MYKNRELSAAEKTILQTGSVCTMIQSQTLSAGLKCSGRQFDGGLLEW